jgi:hypothetical protein
VGEVIIATPAISERMLIVRGQHHVFGIGEKAAAGKQAATSQQ